MLAKVHQARREPHEVGDGVEEDLGSLVHGLAVTPLGHVLDAVHVGCRDEFLEGAELLALGVGEDERGVDVRLLDLFAAHLQIVDELNVDGRLVGGRGDVDVLRWRRWP